jgi:hypothetical protein
MKDKSLGILLTALFGLSGLAVITLAWLWPTLESERFMATVAGSFGILIATSQTLKVRRPPGTERERIPVEVDSPR